MPLEIERKFLVASDAWRPLATHEEHLRDGIIATKDGRQVRVRLYANRATLTIKSAQHGITRAEFEYDIPRTDAEELLARHCDGNIVEKTRHTVPHLGFTWEVDVYTADLAGLVVAEIELTDPAITIPLPPWLGREVTNDPAYAKANLRTSLAASSG